MKILLIEDDELDAVHFKLLLKSEPEHEVHVETNLTDGIARCHHDRFDLAVLDLSLPDSEGLETFRGFLAGVPSAPAVVLLTGSDDRELAIEAVQSGAQDFVVKGAMKPATLLQVLRHAYERHQLAQELMAANQRVRHLATHCPLTDLPNRFLFMKHLEKAIVASMRSKTNLGVLFLDLDHFKPINDTYGHQAGDRVLQTVANRLKGMLRASDTVARLGGDEFTILLNEVADPVAIEGVASKIERALTRPIDLDGREIVVRPSIGIATYPRDGRSAESILCNADAAMYSAKRSGESHRFWSENLRIDARRRLDFESDLAEAIANDGLELHYQPQVEITTGAIVGVEALARWNRPGEGPVSPIEFISRAEQCGLIEPLGLWVLRTAARTQARWLERGLDAGRMSINVSPRQLAERSFVAKVRGVLEEFSLAPHDITLEITESCLIDDSSIALDTLHRLRADGLSIAVDDFGTGHSSLGRLASLPVDCLKIDRQFVRGAPRDPRMAATTRAIIHLAKELEFDLTAEGVEDEAESNFLLENGCTQVQGFLYSRPIPEREVEVLLAARCIAPRPDPA